MQSVHMLKQFCKAFCRIFNDIAKLMTSLVCYGYCSNEIKKSYNGIGIRMFEKFIVAHDCI